MPSPPSDKGIFVISILSLPSLSIKALLIISHTCDALRVSLKESGAISNFSGFMIKPFNCSYFSSFWLFTIALI